MIPLKDDIPTRRTPVVTVALIAVNLAVFGWQLLGPHGFPGSVLQLGLVPDALFGNSVAPAPFASVLTSMFAHGSLLHIGSNMLFLWIFGNNVEDDMGRLRFVLFYVLCGLGAAFAQILSDPNSTVPMVGASGAIAGVLGAYLLLYPHARVLTLVPIVFFLRLIWIPAVVFLGLWFLFQLVGLQGASAAGIAGWAHVGGFLVGVVLVKPFAGRIWRTDREGGYLRSSARGALRPHRRG